MLARTFVRDFDDDRLWTYTTADGHHPILLEFMRHPKGRPPDLWSVFYQDEPDEPGMNLGVLEVYHQNDIEKAVYRFATAIWEE